MGRVALHCEALGTRWGVGNITTSDGFFYPGVPCPRCGIGQTLADWERGGMVFCREGHFTGAGRR